MFDNSLNGAKRDIDYAPVGLLLWQIQSQFEATAVSRGYIRHICFKPIKA